MMVTIILILLLIAIVNATPYGLHTRKWSAKDKTLNCSRIRALGASTIQLDLGLASKLRPALHIRRLVRPSDTVITACTVVQAVV